MCETNFQSITNSRCVTLEWEHIFLWNIKLLYVLTDRPSYWVSVYTAWRDAVLLICNNSFLLLFPFNSLVTAHFHRLLLCPLLSFSCDVFSCKPAAVHQNQFFYDFIILYARIPIVELSARDCTTAALLRLPDKIARSEVRFCSSLCKMSTSLGRWRRQSNI